MTTPENAADVAAADSIAIPPAAAAPEVATAAPAAAVDVPLAPALAPAVDTAPPAPLPGGVPVSPGGPTIDERFECLGIVANDHLTMIKHLGDQVSEQAKAIADLQRLVGVLIQTDGHIGDALLDLGKRAGHHVAIAGYAPPA